jgi:hypothetical protein
MSKLTRKLQVLLSEEQVSMINRIILNQALESGERPVSISAFIRDLLSSEIEKRAHEAERWNPANIKKIKSK